MADKHKGTDRGDTSQSTRRANGTRSREAPPSKIEAVRRAVAELGDEAHRKAIQDFIQDQFGIQMSVDHVSAAKAEVLRKAREGTADKALAAGPAVGSRAQRLPLASAPIPESGLRPTPSPDEHQVVLLEDIATVKELLQRVGPEQLRALIEIMSR